jgi:putative ABC transport system permease protein
MVSRSMTCPAPTVGERDRVIHFIWSHLRMRAGRSMALLLGVLTATTGFTVLTGTTDTARLRVTGTLDANARAAYDILVRPRGSRSALETDRGLVRPNYLSGQFGGLTTKEYEQIRAVPGVELAAPIAMLGYAMVTLNVSFDVTDAVDRNARQQVIRLAPTLVADRGLTRQPAPPSYVYVTRNELIAEVADASSDSLACGAGAVAAGRPFEVLPGGRRALVCDTRAPVQPDPEGKGALNGLTAEQRTSLQVYQLTGRGDFRGVRPEGGFAPAQPRLIVSLPVTVPFLLAAVDPRAEAALAGTDRAITAGRYLAAGDRPSAGKLPVIASVQPYLDEQLSVGYSRVDGAGVAGTLTSRLRERLGSRPGVAAGAGQGEVADAYRRAMSYAVTNRQGNAGTLNLVIRAGAPAYRERPDGALTVRPREPALDAYRSVTYAGTAMPGLALDTGYRPLSRLTVPPAADLTTWTVAPLGLYDPEKLAGFAAASKVPLETYQPPTATGADEATRRLLGNRTLLPDENPAGYLATPPLMLTDLANLRTVFGAAADRNPLSAVRVRVGDISGYDKAAAERVRRTAEAIALKTGLDVDITFGSSPTPRTVVLPAGKFGRPDLQLTEMWSRKGVAAVIVQAVDRKSLLLFGLILVVCLLFLANAVTAAVRNRRRELAILTCMGWPARSVGAAILGEVALLGLAAGLLSLLLALPVCAAAGIHVPLAQAALAVPIGLLLALLAGLVPALRAARAHPASALRPPVLSVRRARRRRTVVGLAAVNLGRVPGRTLLGALSLAIGVCAVTLLAAVQWAFRGEVQGTLLGDAVSLSVRGVDVVAAIATVLLGLVGLTDLLYLNIRDRAAEFAVLRVTGWSERALGRLVTYEGLGVGLLGATIGATAGLAGVSWFVGDLRTSLIWTTAGTAVAGLLVSALAAMTPALWLRRLPVTALLTED